MPSPLEELLILPEVRASLVLLRGAREAAAIVGVSPTRLSLPRNLLLGTGLTEPLLASLCHVGLIDRLDTGFVLAELGARLTPRRPRRQGARGGTSPPREDRPGWDRGSHQLRLDGQVVKRLSPLASAQMDVLDAFERAGWPRMIPNPFGGPPREALVKLRAALRNLNYSQVARLITFRVKRGCASWRRRRAGESASKDS